jgi:3-oxoadipate enol-lactonase
MNAAVTVDGVSVAYDVAGRGEPLVLLPGQANNRHWWDPIRPDFTDDFTTIAIDTRGTGESSAPADAAYSTRRFAQDVIAVLDTLDITRAHVYGTSMGGKIAQWLAIEHPDRVAALVLGCTTAGGRHGLVAGPDVVGPLAGPADSAERALAELMFSPGWLATHPGPYAVLGNPTMSASARRGHRRASAEHDAWDALLRIDAPTLVIHGTDDQFCPTGNAALLAERLPRATVRLIEGARHAYFEECRAEASPAVLGFLHQVAAASA